VSIALAPNPRTAEQPDLDALGRLKTLCDRGSLELIRSDVQSGAMGEKARAGDGVLAGAGQIDGRPVFCYAQDASYAGGSLGEQHANTIVRVLELADKTRAPVVGFVSSGGARMQEGVAALGGYGRIFHRIVKLSGRVPQVSIITGLSARGGAYSPALTDWVVMTEQSSMFLTGPGVVREAMGEDVTADELGGTRVHERNGVCTSWPRRTRTPPTWRASCWATCRATATPVRRCSQRGRRWPTPRTIPCRTITGACTTCAT
jgi:acetyl-CoA carboxylase carboxyltransferase component